jgi:hypothetical protein
VTRSRRGCKVAFLAFALIPTVISVGAPARADEAACIAASENEVALRKAGKLQAALKELALCAQPACSSEIRTECTKRIADVRAAEPSVVLAVTDESGNDLGAVTVGLDGAVLTTSLDGRSTMLDPGPHTLRFEASGMQTVEKQIIVREGEKDRKVSVVLKSAAPPSPPPAPLVVPPPAPEPTPPVQAVSSGSWNRRKTLAIVTGAVGVGGVALGSVFGLLARSDWSSSESLCSPGACPTPSARAQAVDDQQSASTKAVVSTVGFGVRAAAIAGAVVLWVTAPSARKAEVVPGGGVGVWPLLGPGHAGAVLIQQF